MFKFMQLILTNQSALFKHSIARLLLILFMTSALVVGSRANYDINFIFKLWKQTTLVGCSKSYDHFYPIRVEKILKFVFVISDPGKSS